MSWFRFTGPSRGGDKSLAVWDRIFSSPRSRKRGSERRNGRLLRIDELEKRCLLSVTPGDLSAVIVNQTFGAGQSTTTAHSVASDNNGDFVVTWTRTDSLTSSNGTIYPVNNVYARYFTDTVEQVNLPTALATTPGSSAQPTFSLKYNDQTIEQISVTAGIAASGDANPPADPLITGTFDLWYNATGNDTIGQNVATVTGGTQSDLLTVTYDETNPTDAAEQIQAWLTNFAPVAANSAIGFAGSDATHAIVNSIDPHTFVVDYGTATQGLDQSSLLQYVSTETPAASQNLSFTSTAGSVTTIKYDGNVTVTPNPVQGTFELQVGMTKTTSINFDSTNLAATATAMQTALVNAGFAGATVQSTSGFSPFTFNVTFTTAEPPIQYVATRIPLQVSVTNSADVSTLTGFLPTVTLSTLDRPFTISNIPFSQTNPTLTAEGISGAFQQAVDAYSTGIAPINFVSLSQTGEAQNAYTAPIYNNVGTTGLSTPTTGWDPTVSVQPVVSLNTSGTDITSFTQFTVTFTSVFGTTVDAPLVVTSYVTADGTASTSQTSLLDGAVSLPANVSGSSVQILKQTGNEFQVDPPQPSSIYTENIQPLNSDQPAVAMDGSGDFVISWTGDVSQELAPKDVSNIYFRMYSPVGMTSAGTAVAGEVGSDLYQQQQLTFNFAGNVPSSNTDTFALKIGTFTTDAITFNTDPATTAANIQAALETQFPGVAVAAASSANPFNFDVTFNTGGINAQLIQYVASMTSPLPSTLAFSANSSQAFTGVRLVTNPTQQLTFDFTAGSPGSVGNVGTFELQVGSTVTAPITFSTNPTTTARNLQSALTAAGFPGVAVTAQSGITITPTFFTFDVTFSGYNIPPAQYIPVARCRVVYPPRSRSPMATATRTRSKQTPVIRTRSSSPT